MLLAQHVQCWGHANYQIKVILNLCAKDICTYIFFRPDISRPFHPCIDFPVYPCVNFYISHRQMHSQATLLGAPC